MNELTPCPFCGSDDVHTQRYNICYSVECFNCECLGPSGTTADEAAQKWNTRHQSPGRVSPLPEVVVYPPCQCRAHDGTLGEHHEMGCDLYIPF